MLSAYKEKNVIEVFFQDMSGMYARLKTTEASLLHRNVLHPNNTLASFLVRTFKVMFCPRDCMVLGYSLLQKQTSGYTLIQHPK